MARKSRVPVAAGVCVEMKQADFRAGQYSRLSVEDGDDVEQNSIGNQKKIGFHYLESHPEIKLVDNYYDHGYTGMNYNRPEFKRLLHDLQIGRINCVIVKDISRLGRHFVMTSEFVERTFPQMGVRLICINDDYDSEDKNANASALTLPLKMVMNDYYVKDISKKIRSSINSMMDEGEFLPSASSVPYGYIRNPVEITYDIDQEVAPIILRIFKMRAERMGYHAIARVLNEEGILSPGKLRYVRGITNAKRYENALWLRGTLRKILSDPVYIGNRVHGKVKRDKIGMDKKRRSKDEWQIIEGTHPAIVPKSLFDLVQQINQEELEKRSGFTERAKVGDDYRDLFRGMIFCAECGASMSAAKGCARMDAKTPSRLFYDCNTYRYSSHVKCGSHYIRQEAIYAAVKDTLDQQLRAVVDFEKLANEIRAMPQTIAYQNSAEVRHRNLVQKRKNIEAKMEQLLIDLTQRVIDRGEYDYMKKCYMQQHEQLLEEETRASAEAKVLDQAINSSHGWLEAVRQYEKYPEVTRSLLEQLVEKIEVSSDRHVKITLNYADPCQPLVNFLARMEEMRNVV